MKKKYILVSKAKVKKIYRLDTEEFKSLLNDAVRNQLIDGYRLEQDPEKKRKLKLEMWGTLPHAGDFTDDIRHDESAVPSQFVYADFDSADNPHMGDPREYYLKYIAPQLDELHAFDVHVTVSGKGLHIGTYLPQNATIAQAQEWIGKKVGLVSDRKCTNLSRLFIAPKAEDYLYLDWKALFGEKETEPWGCVKKMHPHFFITKSLLSQAGALIYPKVFVSLGKSFHYGKDTLSFLHSQPIGAFSATNR